MSPILKWILNYRIFIFSGFMFLLALGAFEQSHEKPVYFNKLQWAIAKLDRDISHLGKKLLTSNPNFYKPIKTSFLVHVYSGDSLVYWNTNKIPVSKFANIQFPSDGMNRLQNGWYYSKVFQKNEKKIVVSYLIRSEFDYENAFLENKSNQDLTESSFTISLNPTDGYQIKNYSGDYLFSAVSPNEKQNDNPWILVFICLSLASAAVGFYLKSIGGRGIQVAVSIVVLFVIRALFLITDVHHLFEYQSFVSADLFGYDQFFPTFFDFCLNVIVGSSIYALIGLFIQRIKFGNYLIVLWYILGWYAILEIIKILVLYSAIPLDFLDFFDLTIYSYLSLFVIGFGLFMIYKIVGITLKSNDKRSSLLIGLVAFASFLMFLVLQKNSFFSSTFPLIPILVFKINRINSATKSFLLLTLFSMVLVTEFNRHQIQKEQENRKLYARQLAIEQDINLELAYAEINEKLKEDQLIKSVSKNQAEQVSQSDFGDILEKKYFKGEWDVYEQTFNLCDSSGKSIFTSDFQFFQSCKNLIDKYGEVSAVNPSLFFIKASTGGVTYIIREKISIEGSDFLFFVVLKSKRIPEEIGFPRLLISKNANILNSLEHYSVGKYSDKKLIRSFGSFHFPTSLDAFPNGNKKEQFINYDGHNHYIFASGNEQILLTLRNYAFVDFVSAFALVFSFLGLILLCSVLLTKGLKIQHTNLSLSLKIQYAVLLLVMFILILFAAGSGYYVRKQFQQNSDEVIENKLVSVEEELRGKVSSFSHFNIETQGSFLESQLVKFARVFETDLNIYDKNGYLIASSRSKVFNQGLLSEQINPEAFEKIKRERRSFFTQKENIGQLNYISSYQPIYNGEEKLLGYLNLQHFGQQQAFEEQLKSFIIAVVNVFIILLLLSIGIALLVSNWVTSPLKLLQKRVTGLEITSDVKIEYSGKDEIGLIVSAYNLKLDELKNAAKKLAKSERESAWREMAQQVAHEIKNPLTPMKLSIQQMLRVYDPLDVQSTDKVKRVLNSIIEQIDGMTRIANEFSSFAKMPEPKKKEIDLFVLIQNTVSLFESEETITFNIESSENELPVNVDKEQWVQVFNNLIQNAIHALEGIQNGEINISIRRENNSIFIEVSDNGCGISEEEQEKLFVPYFTTKSSGSGIGLSMVKQIIENHDGHISFVSRLNEGTTFQIKL